MSTDVEKVEVPQKLLNLIKEYKNVSYKIARERFVQYIEEYGLEHEGFSGYCERLVTKGLFKRSFLPALEEEGYLVLDDSVSFDEDVIDTDNGEDFIDDSASDSVIEDTSSDDVDATDEDDDKLTVADIQELTGDHSYRAEFEDPAHASLTYSVLDKVGFTVDLDARLGGDIVRSRGGKYVLNIYVADKKACKRRVSEANPDGLGPVIRYTNQLVQVFEAKKAIILLKILSKIKPA